MKQCKSNFFLNKKIIFIIVPLHLLLCWMVKILKKKDVSDFYLIWPPPFICSKGVMTYVNLQGV